MTGTERSVRVFGVCVSASEQYHLLLSLIFGTSAEPEIFSARERSFLHARVHHDYQTTIMESCFERITFMHQHPGQQFYLLFDYTHGFERPQVRSVAAPPDPTPSEGSAAQWADHVARAARSGGRMDLLVVLVADGSHIRRRMAPVRTPTSALHNGLTQIAVKIPPALIL